MPGVGPLRRGENVRAQVDGVRNRFRQDWLSRLTSDASPMSPYRVVWELMHTVDRTRTVLTHDAGHPRDQVVPFYESLVPRGYPGGGSRLDSARG
jgi:hypothetical protein